MSNIKEKLLEIFESEYVGKPKIRMGYAGEFYEYGEHNINELIPILSGIEERYLNEIFKYAKKISEYDKEASFHYLKTSVEILKDLGFEHLKYWSEKILEEISKNGKIPKEYFQYTRGLREKLKKGVSLDDVKKILVYYLKGLSGYDISIKEGDFFTDIKNIYLPKYIDKFPNEDLNFLYYKIKASDLWYSITQAE